MGSVGKAGKQVRIKCNSSKDLMKCCWAFITDLDILPVGPPFGIQEVAIYVVFLVREERLCGNVDHPGTAVASHPQM